MADSALSALFDEAQAHPANLMTCSVCSESCARTSPNQKYCVSCRRAQKNKNNRVRVRVYALRGGKGVAGLDKKCAWCGTVFKTRRGQNRYCSSTCRRAKEQKNRRSRRAQSGARVIGSIFACDRCGTEIVISGPSHLYCDKCRKESRAETFSSWRDRNPEKVKEIQAKAWEKKKDSDSYREWARIYFKDYTREKRQDPRHRLDHRMGQLLRSGLRNKNGRAWESLVGYTLDELFAHIERQFLPGMSWGNMDEWHVDHIRPKSSFSYESEDDPEFKECWALTNLRPLWAKDNLSKGGKRLYLI